MRETIDFGIDLGTTNSAIAVAEEGSATVIKNYDGADYTPSAVWIPRADRVTVGRGARTRLATDPDDVAAEFKLEMGLADARRTFRRADLTLTPAQLSSEVLKSLRGDAAQLYEVPTSAVITVPAAFGLNQTKATQQAAELAGLGPHCPLLQEPTAAAFAFGARRDVEDRSSWMVFDFGGGTFDAAVVASRDGELQVLNHAGDPFLGGKLIDWALVEQVIAPAVAREFSLDGFTRDDPRWQSVFMQLKAFAEEAKVRLSRESSVVLDVDLLLPTGREAYEVHMTRDEHDRIAEPFWDRAIGRCREALSEGGLRPDDIDVLLLVGGATLAPGLRERVRDPGTGLGIRLDHSQDPSTVVARGAALFAATVRAMAAEPVGPVAAGAYRVHLEYEPTTSSPEPPVAGRVTTGGQADWRGWTVVLEDATRRPPYRGESVALDDRGAFLTRALARQDAAARFSVLLFDPAGTPVPLSGAEFTLTWTDNEVGGPVLTQSLGIARADGTYASLARKGAALPVRSRETFVTTIPLRRAEPGATVRIPVVEGEFSRADRNREVGMLEIRPTDLDCDLPSGSEIEITLDVNASRLLSVVADVTMADEQFEAEIELDFVSSPAVEDLERRFREVLKRIEHLRGTATAAGSGEAHRRLDAVEEGHDIATARDQVRAAGVDVGAAAAADSRLREVQADLDAAEELIALPNILRQIDDTLSDVAPLLESRGEPNDRREAADIRTRAAALRTHPDVEAATVLFRRAQELLVRLLRAGPEWEAVLFNSLRARREDMLDTAEADRLIRDGELAVASDDRQTLGAVNSRLQRLLPSGVSALDGGVTTRLR